MPYPIPDWGQTVFFRTAELSAADATTRVSLIADDEVVGGKRLYLVSFRVAVKLAGTDWTSPATEVYIEGSGLGGDRFATIPIASFASGAIVTEHTASVDLDQTIFVEGNGGLASTGLTVVADDIPGAGDNLVITVFAFSSI